MFEPSGLVDVKISQTISITKGDYDPKIAVQNSVKQAEVLR